MGVNRGMLYTFTSYLSVKTCLHSLKRKIYNNIKPQIMKRIFSTFGLTAIVIILTSFTTPETTNTIVTNNTNTEVVNGSVLSNRKMDAVTGSVLSNRKMDAVTGSVLSNRKMDAVNGSVLSNRKMD